MRIHDTGLRRTRAETGSRLSCWAVWSCWREVSRATARILVHYMINGGFLGAGGAANRDNNYILDHIARLRNIPVHVVHGRYDRVCHLYQAEALVRALRDAGNNTVSYFIATAGHSSFEPETDTRLRTIMNELPPMTSPEMALLQRGEAMRHAEEPSDAETGC